MEHISKIAFPGIGIGEFEVSNVAFDIADILSVFGIKIGSFPVYWYGIIITMGILVAFLYVVFRGKYEGIKSDSIVDVAVWAVVIAIVGARLYFVFSKPEDFFVGSFIESIKRIVDLRSGGLAIYGGVIGGIIGVVLVTQIKKINSLKLLDMGAPALMFAQTMGRWGNFMNGEAYGGLVENGNPLYFLRMDLCSYNTQHDTVLKEVLGDFPQGMVSVHPTFFYESLWNLVGFIIINILYKKKKFNGQVLCMYLAWYGIGRFFIEALRTDSLYIPNTEIRVSQLVGILCFVIFGAVIVAGLIYAKKRLYAPGAALSAIDSYVKPSLEMHPVFFEKKSDENKADEGADKIGNGAEDITEESEEKESEEDENGTDN